MVPQHGTIRATRSAPILGALVGLLLLLSSTAPYAQSRQPENGAAYLERMAGYLQGLSAFEVTINSGYDVVQPDGQKLEFVESRKVAARRPNQLRVEMIQSDGSEALLVFDGEQISLSSPADQVYATTATTGTIDDAITYVTDKLGARVPLAILLSSTLSDQLRSRLRQADVVETRTLDGIVQCHIAARGDDVDVQVWLAEGDKPLPSRVVITYKKEKGMPQFRADLSGWKTSTDLAPSDFEFTPPAGFEQIQIKPVIDPKVGSKPMRGLAQ